MRILLDGVSYDLVVQRDALDWIVADSDGAVYSRHPSESAARAALDLMARRLLAGGGRQA